MIEDIWLSWNGSLLPSERFFIKPPIDEELIYLLHEKSISVGKAYKELANLDMWVAVSNVTQMPAEYWLSQDMFWQQAYFQAVNEFIIQQNKKQKEVMEGMSNSIKDSAQSTPYISPMANMPKPNFFMS